MLGRDFCRIQETRGVVGRLREEREEKGDGKDSSPSRSMEVQKTKQTPTVVMILFFFLSFSLRGGQLYLRIRLP